MKQYTYTMPEKRISIPINTENSLHLVKAQALLGIMERLESVGKSLEVIADTIGKDWEDGYHQGEIDGYERGYQLGQEEPPRPLGA